MKKHKLHIDTTEYKAKPTEQEISRKGTGINDRITNHTVEVTIAELALRISQGNTLIASYIDGKRENKNFRSQSLFLLDFDNTERVNDPNDPTSKKKIKRQVSNPISPQKVLDRLEEYGLQCSLIYPSFSHSEEWQRFRVAFQIEETITDIEKAKLVINSLLMLFPEADRCKDPCRIWYGTSHVSYYENHDSYLDIEKLVECSVIHWASHTKTGRYDKSNAARQIKIALKKLNSDEKRVNPLYIKTNTHNSSKNNDSQIRSPIQNEKTFQFFLEGSKYSAVYSEILEKGHLENVSFEELAKKVKILADFMNSDIKLGHEKLLGLATNLYWIKRGKALYKKCIDANPNYAQKKHTVMFYCKQVEYIPMALKDFSPYEEDWEYRNILQAAKLPRAEIIRKQQYETISLAEGEARLDDAISQALNDEGNHIYVIRKATGLGGTERLLSIENATVAFPNHDLKEEVSGRFNVDHETTPELPFDAVDEGLKAKIEYLYGVGAVDRVIRILQEEALHNPEIRKYLDDSAKAYSSKKTVLTTHTKALFVGFEHDTLVFDEDPLAAVLEIGEVTLNDLNNLSHKVSNPNDRETLGSCVKFLTTTGEESKLIENITFADVDSIEDVVLDAKDFNSNVLKFIRSNFHAKDDYSHSSLRFLTHNSLNSELLAHKKIIIISATADEFIYRKLYGDRVKFIDISNVEMKGSVVQDTRYSYSRSSLGQAEVRNYVEQKASDFEYLVTFKQYKYYFPNAVEDIHYGKCTGFDRLKGQRIAVVGTPHLRTVDYLLYAQALGIQESLHNFNLQQQRVEHNGFEFRFRTFPTKSLQLIQFHFIEEQMIQALGRARALREPVETILFSNYPLPFSLFTEDEIIQGRKKLEESREDFFKESDSSFTENDEIQITSPILVDADFLSDVQDDLNYSNELDFQDNQIVENEVEEIANLLD